MRTKDKLILTIILFLGFIVFSNNDCLGYTITKENIEVSTYNGAEHTMNFNITIPDEYIENYTYVFCNIQTYSSLGMKNKGRINFIFSNNTISFEKLSSGVLNLSGQFYVITETFTLSNTTYSHNFSNLNLINLEDYYLTFYNMGTDVSRMRLMLSTFDIFLKDGTLVFEKTMDPIHGAEPDVDKLNLFELNLTDLDYNNQVHQFNLSTYTDSECYDEIMEYYIQNYQYAIYMTDYQRILTYGEEDNDDSFQYGSYMLSGYIDFLTKDDAVFFYDKEEQKIRVGTGLYDSITPTDKYIKRFYFKLTYSEDSNDPNVEIWSNNGNLFPITVSQIENSYFIGSSQTIYYASNTYKYNTYFMSQTVYYKGYLNPFEFGEKVRDISSTPFYVYNFSFGGGTTKLLFSNSSTYTEDISNIYNDIQENYNTDEIPEDTGDGSSYIQGADSTSSTYNEWEVTDDTTAEEDAEHEGGIRTPTSNSSEDRSNWGILDYLSYILDKIIAIPGNILEGLYNIFIPTDKQWYDIQQSYSELQILIQTKIPFVADFKNRLEEAPDNNTDNDFLNITMPSFSYYGGQTETVTVINVKQAYEPYRENIRNLLALIVYGCGFVFILKHVLNYTSNSNKDNIDKGGD